VFLTFPKHHCPHSASLQCLSGLQSCFPPLQHNYAAVLWASLYMFFSSAKLSFQLLEGRVCRCTHLCHPLIKNSFPAWSLLHSRSANSPACSLCRGQQQCLNQFMLECHAVTCILKKQSRMGRREQSRGAVRSMTTCVPHTPEYRLTEWNCGAVAIFNMSALISSQHLSVFLL
jgi:hypothetical protein